MNVPIGIRLNNPGNLLVLEPEEADPWQGLNDPALIVNTETGHYHYSYVDPKWGIRAMVRTLHTYREHRNLKTLTEIVGQWAPSHENPTDGYIKGVATLTGFEPDEVIDVYNFEITRKLVRAIIRWENGLPGDGRDDWYEHSVYEHGLRLAGVSPQKPLAKSRTTKGAATAVGATGAAIGILSDVFGLPPEIAELLPTALTSLSEEATAIVVLVIGLVGAGYTIYARMDDKKMGRL